MTKYNKNNKFYKGMCERVGQDFEKWLRTKYWEEEKATREISELAYGVRTNSPNVIGWMKKLDIPTRERSDAVALQWKDNGERRKQQALIAKKKMSAGTPGRKRLIKLMQTDEYKKKQRISKTGERNGMWNPNLTEEDRMHTRNYRDYKEFKDGVLKRDGYTCIRCQSKRVDDLVVHHINGYHWDEGSRTEIDNGATLCEKCHKEFHSIYGYGNNDLFQFAQFMDLTLTK